MAPWEQFNWGVYWAFVAASATLFVVRLLYILIAQWWQD
jgi:hypothetical protein